MVFNENFFCQNHMKHWLPTAIFATPILILVMYIGGILRNDWYTEKFDEVPLGTSLDEIQTEWDQPDADLSAPGDSLLIVRYSKGVEIWGNFIFKFDRDKKLVLKYLDD